MGPRQRHTERTYNCFVDVASRDFTLDNPCDAHSESLCSMHPSLTVRASPRISPCPSAASSPPPCSTSAAAPPSAALSPGRQPSGTPLPGLSRSSLPRPAAGSRPALRTRWPRQSGRSGESGTRIWGSGQSRSRTAGQLSPIRRLSKGEDNSRMLVVIWRRKRMCGNHCHCFCQRSLQERPQTDQV